MNNRPRNLLFIVKALNHTSGGAERVLCTVANGLAERGHRISILSFDPESGKGFYPLNDKIQQFCLPIGNVQKPTSFKDMIQRAKAIRKHVRQYRPECIIPFMHSAFIPTAFGTIGTGTPIIASEHIVPAHYNKKPFQFFLLKISRFWIDRYTAVSEAVKTLYPVIINQKMDVMTNPLRSITAQADPIGGENKIILNVGRLSMQKNQAALIKAFAKIADDFPQWALRIVGEGELRPNLETLIRKLNLGDRVFLAGRIKDIDKEYKSAQFFVLPSTYESQGLATVEALAHGLPSIGLTSCPGTNELIENNKNGFLV